MKTITIRFIVPSDITAANIIYMVLSFLKEWGFESNKENISGGVEVISHDETPTLLLLK